MTKVGLAMGYDADTTVRRMAETARQAEERGFDMAFFSEALLVNRDSVSALAAFSLSTSTILLGCTQVVRLRSAVLMAQSLATLDELSAGRLVLAPGACTDKHARRHGLAPFPPAVSLREWVETVRKILAGERLTFKGESIEIENGGLNFRPVRPHIPFWFASLSKTGMRLAAQIGDGILLDAHTSPEYVENAVKFMREVVRDAGRSWEDFQVAQIIPTSVEDTHAAAIDAVRWEAASRFESPNFPAETERRLRVGEPAVRREMFPPLMQALTTGGKRAVAAALPVELIDQTTATGTPDHVMSRVERYRKAGITFPLLRPQAPHQVPRVLELFGKKR